MIKTGVAGGLVYGDNLIAAAPVGLLGLLLLFQVNENWNFRLYLNIIWSRIIHLKENIDTDYQKNEKWTWLMKRVCFWIIYVNGYFLFFLQTTRVRFVFDDEALVSTPKPSLLVLLIHIQNYWVVPICLKLILPVS